MIGTTMAARLSPAAACAAAPTTSAPAGSTGRATATATTDDERAPLLRRCLKMLFSTKGGILAGNFYKKSSNVFFS
jgi:hypothetical protein